MPEPEVQPQPEPEPPEPDDMVTDLVDEEAEPEAPAQAAEATEVRSHARSKLKKQVLTSASRTCVWNFCRRNTCGRLRRRSAAARVRAGARVLACGVSFLSERPRMEI